MDSHADPLRANGQRTTPSRLDRRLRERELLRIRQSFSLFRNGGCPDSPITGDWVRAGEGDFLEALSACANETTNIGSKNHQQRLLVVANRLPVSANRKSEKEWSLEISAGGLVSALLGLS